MNDSVRITTLPNGLRIATDRMEHVESVSLGAWVGVGTRHEQAEINGISHLLEHMAFKGTERRSPQAIAEEIEAVGGVLNAYTSRENTAYYAKVLAEDTPLAVDIVADILQHSTFDETELKREQQVVVQEIGQANDTPDDIIFDFFQEAAYPDQPMGRPVLGTVETVTSMGRDTLMEYIGGQYGPQKMVFAAAGKVDHDALVELVGNAFADLKPTPVQEEAPAAYRGGERREDRDLEQVHLLLGFDSIAYDDPDYYALSVFSTLFGGGMSSRLFQEIREKRGLVYSIYSFQSAFRDGGLFGVYAGTGDEQVAELVPVLCDSFREIAGSLTEAELGRARAQLKAGLLMGRESTGNRCEQVAQQLLVYGRIVPPSELVEKVEAVDAAAVDRVVARLLASRPTLATIGPIAHVEPLDRIAERLAA
ncbi:M16 family metallopeptidase [Oceanibaculum pacificum]|uniref:Peptidase M16 n=1 Tax=Oceanibaculum pacificum TaxID=580166 RepID=A0A154WF93_9PROT|nr:pitrilysin family protein [Oceanibaculum pacificum]KZD12156.1 peptidase M16 [Oceanibaculum pacificum]